jgi:periplasmic divalent cation tolerance protein
MESDMAMSPTKIAISMSTVEEAPALARMLVEKRLAACVNILPGARSVYRWKEKIEEANEAMLVIKTTEDKVVLVEEALKSLHSYELPEFVVLNVDGGSEDYLHWIQANVR